MKYTLLWTAGEVTHKENTYDDGLVVQNIPVEILEHGTMFHLVWTEARTYMQYSDGKAPRPNPYVEHAKSAGTLSEYSNGKSPTPPNLTLDSFKDAIDKARDYHARLASKRKGNKFCKHGCTENIWFNACPQHGGNN